MIPILNNDPDIVPSFKFNLGSTFDSGFVQYMHSLSALAPTWIQNEFFHLLYQYNITNHDPDLIHDPISEETISLYRNKPIFFLLRTMKLQCPDPNATRDPMPNQY
ncbi:hypothetical protein EVAR_40373_1 [Eumeta japonica]|uniref:Uncharacterized protein n=1 Tax=Eumeta variegata TaxID=151549 RepID=A0A4C1XKU8_EUMVA|nr:hypothetical protein EVAR_40373_1 [Eumeta japonica]